MTRSAVTAAALFVAACASGPTPRPSRSPERTIAEVNQQRLNRVHAEAPEVAQIVVRVRRLAAEYAARGDVEASEALVSLSQVTLLSASELIARLEAAEARAESDRRVLALMNATDEAVTEVDEAEAPASEPARQRPARRAARRAPEPAEPPADETDAEETSDADRVRERLARLASRLSDLPPSEESQVVIEGVQRRLIQADRALAEGLNARATELVQEAERLLAPLTGEPAPPAASIGNTFLREARERLGQSATIHGTAVAVRLDLHVGYRNGTWQARGTTAALTGLRALVRGYRSAPLTLVRVGEPSEPAFEEEAEALRRFLTRRFQIRADRIRVSDAAAMPLPFGTYLIVQSTDQAG